MLADQTRVWLRRRLFPLFVLVRLPEVATATVKTRPGSRGVRVARFRKCYDHVT